MTHQLTFRGDSPDGTAQCACGRILRVEDLPHVDLDTMLDYLDARGIPRETALPNERAA